MMARTSKLFDNLMQMIGTNITVAGTTAQSVELDLELPRGYVAKIKKVIVSWRNVFDLMVTTDSAQLLYALLNDPDDTVTNDVPENSVEHDVIVAGDMEAFSLVDLSHRGSFRHEIDFDQELDVISARNLRFNITVIEADVDGSVVVCQVFYTLEKIQDAQIMELFDIL